MLPVGQTCAIIFNNTYTLITRTGQDNYTCNTILASPTQGYSVLFEDSEEIDQVTVTQINEVSLEEIVYVDLIDFFEQNGKTLVEVQPYSAVYSQLPLFVTTY